MSKKCLLYLPLLVFGGLFCAQDLALAYSDTTTHPALTDEIADYYNSSFPNDPMSIEEKEWLIEGSRLEDTPPRWINHFYDPVNKVGWTGENAGRIAKEEIQRFSGLALSFEKPLSAVDWVSDANYFIQESYSLYGGNRTWKRGLEYFAEGDRKEAFLTLGHILHILEDMGVPDHTRNDTHAQTGSTITGDTGSPYEDYASGFDRNSIKSLGILNYLNQNGLGYINKSTIQDYLINMAEYSNKYFFSKDTINDQYQFPKIIRDDNNFAYGLDENNKEIKIAKVELNLINNTFKKAYALDENQIFQDYFSHLSRQIVRNGAGVIALFKRQAEDEKVNEEFYAHDSRFQARKLARALTAPNISLVGIGNKIQGFFSNGLAAISGMVNNVTGRLTSLFSTPNTEPNPPPESELVQAPPAELVADLFSTQNRPATQQTSITQIQTPPSETEELILPASDHDNQPTSTPSQTVSSSQPILSPIPSQGSVAPTPGISPSQTSPVPALVRDGTSPSRVTDLRISTTTTSSVTLSWTAPGDDHDSGQAYEYIIRFSTSTLSASSWPAAPRAISTPPQLANLEESLLISGLQPDTAYYFGLIARDESPNDSELSNIASGTTQPEGPVISGFSAVYSSSTMSAEVRWNLVPNQPSSTYVYRLLDITTSTPGVSVFETTSTTSASLGISSQRNFEFRIEDETGIRAATTTVVSSTFYSYLGVIVPQNATSGKYQAGNTSGDYSWTQSFRPQRAGIVDRIGMHWAGPIVGMGGFDDCTLELYSASSPALANSSTLIGRLAGGSPEGTLHGAGCVGGSYSFSSSTIEAGRDYILIYRYRNASHVPELQLGEDSTPGSWWLDGIEHPEFDAALELTGVVLSEEHFTAMPSAPSDLQAVFDTSHGSLALSWSASNDPDSSSALIRYQVNVSTSTLDPAGWRDVGTILATSTRISSLATYAIGVRARDEYGHISSATEISWTPATDLSLSDQLAAQTDQNHVVGANAQDGHRTNTYSQTFAVASSGTPYSIRIATGGTNIGSCSLKIYRAGSMGEASPANLIASSEELSGSACGAANPKTFELATTGPLTPGNTYLWLYTIANSGGMADSVVGGLRPEGGYFGTFSAAVNGTIIYNSDDTQSAYFELVGDLSS